MCCRREPQSLKSVHSTVKVSSVWTRLWAGSFLLWWSVCAAQTGSCCDGNTGPGLILTLVFPKQIHSTQTGLSDRLSVFLCFLFVRRRTSVTSCSSLTSSSCCLPVPGWVASYSRSVITVYLCDSHLCRKIKGVMCWFVSAGEIALGGHDGDQTGRLRSS